MDRFPYEHLSRSYQTSTYGVFLLLLLLLEMLCPNAAFAEKEPQGRDAMLRSSITAFETGDYSRSTRILEDLVAQGKGNSKIHFNLSLAYFKQGQLPQAIAHLRLAKRLNPRDENIRHNLTILREKAPQTFSVEEDVPDSSVQRFVTKVASNLSVAERQILVMALFAAFCLTFIVSFYLSAGKVLFLRVFILLTLALASASYFLVQEDRLGNAAYSWPPQHSFAWSAVVLTPKSSAYSEPSESSQAVSVLSAGTELEVIERRESWSKVKLPLGRQGWLSNSNLLLF
ncbi:hypothetical protein BVY02_02395 [bacterium J17]|nr:hypothetical protein BVY02_02395 [bacterium J17]